jgi:hypothetical protein
LRQAAFLTSAAVINRIALLQERRLDRTEPGDAELIELLLTGAG